jgi:hypothetical protein
LTAAESEVFYLFVYRASWNGRRDAGMETSIAGMKNLLPVLMQDPDICEIVITDAEDLAVFHYKDGTIIFPRA